MQTTWQDIVVWIIGGGVLVLLLWRLYARLSGRRPRSGCASCGVRECPHRRAASQPRHQGGHPEPGKSNHDCPSR